MNVADLTASGIPAWLIVGFLCLFLVGGGAGIAHLVTASATKRKSEAEAGKVSADAVQAIVTAATTLVAPLEHRVEAAELRIVNQDAKIVNQDAAIKDLQHDIHVRDTLASEHAGWDYIAEEKAREAGIALPPRPPLIPHREGATQR